MGAVHFFYGIPYQCIVGIQEAAYFRSCQFHQAAFGIAHALVLFVFKNFAAAIVANDFLYNLEGVVGGAVVKDYGFPVLLGLPEKAFVAILEELSVVVIGDEEG